MGGGGGGWRVGVGSVFLIGDAYIHIYHNYNIVYDSFIPF